MSTKPYTCGSNYLLKMSNYKKGEWCNTVDGLYWRFIQKNRKFYESNPRLSLQVKLLDRMAQERKELIFGEAEKFIEMHTRWSLRRFVKLVISLLPGEKNGVKTGRMSFIVVKNVEEIKFNASSSLINNYKKALNEEGFLWTYLKLCLLLLADSFTSFHCNIPNN